jgi:hypothetical protein
MDIKETVTWACINVGLVVPVEANSYYSITLNGEARNATLVSRAPIGLNIMHIRSCILIILIPTENKN